MGRYLLVFVFQDGLVVLRALFECSEDAYFWGRRLALDLRHANLLRIFHRCICVQWCTWVLLLAQYTQKYWLLAANRVHLIADFFQVSIGKVFWLDELPRLEREYGPMRNLPNQRSFLAIVPLCLNLHLWRWLFLRFHLDNFGSCV